MCVRHPRRPRRAEGQAMILDKYTLLEVRAELSKLPIDKDRCRILLLPEQAWEEAQDQCIHAVEALLVQVLPLVPQPSTVTTVTPDPVAERELAAQHYWQQEFYRVEKMVEAEQDRVEEWGGQLAAAGGGLERQLAAAKEQREAKHIVNSAYAKCFRWLLKHHSGFGKAMAGVGMRCWIGGIEFIGDDVATAILDAIDREEAAAPSGGGGEGGTIALVVVLR